MQVKISKTLEGIIARAAFNTTKAGIDHSLKDFLMLEMLREEGSLAYQLLSSRLKDWELYQVRLRIEREVLGAGRRENTGAEEFYRAFTDELCAVSGAVRSVSTAHALRAIVGDRSTATSRVLEMYGITGEVVSEDIKKFAAGDDFRTEIQVHMLDFSEENKPEEKNTSHVLDKFGVNLTQMAREGKIDPVVGREQEIERVVQILSRRKKNNPILIGEAGVGKSAIIEGLALRIARGEVPYTIADKTLFSLDVSSLVAGTKFRGEFEERMQQLLDELRKAKDTIIFIDEIHTIVGAGAAEGAIDAASILKPVLARGELQLIGATTNQEFRTHIQKDAALERRFGRVQIEEPTPAQAAAILEGLAPRYERYHSVHLPPETLREAVELSVRYLPGRFLPDKAIDLVDEACAMIKTEMDSMPSEMDDLAHRITQLQIEQVSLKKETDALSQSRLKDLEKELAELQDKFRSMKAKWENEKNTIGKVQTLREQIEQTNAAIEKAQREYDLNKAAELKYGKLPQLQKQLAEEEKVAAAKKEDSLLRDRVTDEEIARIVARWTGIPVEKLVEGEREKLLHLDDVLHKRVIGQDEAVTKVSEAILRSRAGIANPNRPIGSFLFLGPTGVGKTELAKALAQALFDDERNMVRIDMTEYMEKFSVSRLIGAPPGYVGYEEGGQLTEAVRRKPYSVVLFDEVEKAHPDVFNILLQVLDDGRITDSQGRTVDFKNTVIILTSNLGSDIILNDLEQRRAQGSNELSEDAKHQIDLLLKSKFRPEFLNRLDEIVYYKSLTKDEMRKIVDLQLQDLRNRMEEGKHLKLEVTTAAKDFIIDSAYDSVYGARPIKRFIQSRVETLIAKAIIKGNYAEGNTLTVDYDGSALVLR